MKFVDCTVRLHPSSSTLALFGLGDFHADDRGFHKRLLREYVEEIRADLNAYVFLLGDYFNALRAKIRKQLRPEPEAMADLDSPMLYRTTQFYRSYLAPLQGRILGAIDGNHRWEFASGETDTQVLCRLTGAQYLGNLAGVRIRVLGLKGGDHSMALTGIIHHGHWGGGASTPGGDLNSVVNKGKPWDVDFVFAGHTHQRNIHISETLTIPTRGRMFPKAVQKATIRTGSFLRQYVPDTSTNAVERYTETKLLSPSELGTDPLYVRFRREKIGGSTFVVHELRKRR
ncbi:MAG: hypothetical protein ABFD96_21420 [Armatimonadia bacterium]